MHRLTERQTEEGRREGEKEGRRKGGREEGGRERPPLTARKGRATLTMPYRLRPDDEDEEERS